MHDELQRRNDERTNEETKAEPERHVTRPADGGNDTPPPTVYYPGAFDLIVDVLHRPKKAFRFLAHTNRYVFAFIVFVLTHIVGVWTQESSLWEAAGIEPLGPRPSLPSFVLTGALGFVIIMLIVHGTARLLGGRNDFDKLLQAQSFARLPGLLVAPFFVFGHMTNSGIIVGAANIVTGLWGLILAIVAVREVYGFSTLRAIGTLMLPFIVLTALFSVLMIVLFLTGPVTLPWLVL